MKKVLIVGGVAVGASAAARLRRVDENAEISYLKKVITFPLQIVDCHIISVE